MADGNLSVLREANIKIYASILMNNTVSLEEKATALNDLYEIFYNNYYVNDQVYNQYGLGIYYLSDDTGNIEATKVPE
jgi:hypothetical protein